MSSLRGSLHLCLFEITTELEQEIIIKSSLKKKANPPSKSYGKPCQICGEKRVYNVCHVIPKEVGGPDGDGNIIFLCPTHHFLFDHSRLNKVEFEKIDRSNLYPEVIEYLSRVQAPKHEMRWRYHTNRFKGCTCCSLDFDYRCRRDKYSVEVVLVCNKCNETWMNLWEDMHPIAQLKTIIYDMRMPESESNLVLDSAQEKILKYIDYLQKGEPIIDYD